MKAIIWMYVIGVVLMIVLTFVANIGVNIREIKLKRFLRTILISLGSWVSMFIIAVMFIKEN